MPKINLILVLKFALVTFIVEALVMVLLPRLGISNANISSLIDAILLVVISSPMTYFWVIKPFVRARVVASNELMLRTSTDGIHILDMDGNLVQFNDAFCNQLGYARDAMQTMNVAELDAQWSPDELQARLRNFLAESKTETFETKHRHHDGYLIDVEISASFVAVDGIPLIYASSRDITKRKKADLLLHQSETKLKAILDNSPFLIWQKDRDGRYLTVNRPMIKVAGKKHAEDLLGKTDFDLWPHDLAQHYSAADAEVLASGREDFFEEKALDGDRAYWVETFKTPIIDDRGNVVGTTGFARDISERKRAEEELRSSEEKLQTLFRMSNFGIARNAMDGRYIEVNDAFLNMVGYSLEELQKLSYWDLTPKQYAEQEAEQLTYLQQEGRYGPYEKEYIHKDGHLIPIRLRGVLVTGSDGGKYIWSKVEDITQQNRIQQELKESEFRWKFALEGSGEGVWDWNIETGKVTVSKRYKEIYGFAEDEWADGTDEWEKRIHPEDRGRVMKAIQAYFDGKTATYSVEHRMQCKDGSWKWIHDRGMVVSRSPDGKPLRMIGTHLDVTERVLLQQELERQARMDYLTGLSNRRYFIEQAESEITRMQRFDRPLSVFMLDIDHFKRVNDTYGHQAGDDVIKHLAGQCMQCLREVDIVGRMGGEEFAILLPETDRDQAQQVAERLRSLVSQSKVPLASGLPLSFTVSIGVTTLAAKTKINIDTLLNQADEALYQAKNAGRNRVSVFQAE